MHGVRFEPTIPGFERAKTVLVLDLTATVIGSLVTYNFYFLVGAIAKHVRCFDILPFFLDIAIGCLCNFVVICLSSKYLIFLLCVLFYDAVSG
jgi:hypothetical protein